MGYKEIRYDFKLSKHFTNNKYENIDELEVYCKIVTLEHLYNDGKILLGEMLSLISNLDYNAMMSLYNYIVEVIGSEERRGK